MLWQLPRRLGLHQDQTPSRCVYRAPLVDGTLTPSSNQMSSASSAPNPFGLGVQIFGDTPSPKPLSTQQPGEDAAADEDFSDADSDSSENSLLTALATTTLTESPWKSAPSYPPIYLSTTSEYLPPQTKSKLPLGTKIEDPSEEDGKGGQNISWASEAYENSMETDYVFDRFTKRVGVSGEQCIRCVLNPQIRCRALTCQPTALRVTVTN